MENYRKSTILEKIIDYTRASVLDGSLSFEQCNALNLALDLKMDRSNVSRILNHIKEQTFIQKQPSDLEGCFCIYARKA